MILTYSELRRIETFEERYEYLALRGTVGNPTFGFDRWLNQQFYMSRQWRNVRRDIIARDMGCDLAVPGFEIHEKLVVHHMNPLAIEDLVHGQDIALEPEFLITTTHQTHNAIHFGDARLLARPLTERRPGDTTPWKA